MKPKLLYIYRDPMDWKSPDVQREYRERDDAIINSLDDKFYVATKKNILTLKPAIAGMFQYILTHLQDDPDTEEFRYGQSLTTISRIHEQYPQIKIVIYTGASERAASDEQLKAAGAKAVIRKHSIRQLHEDIEEIKNCLDGLLNS